MSAIAQRLDAHLAAGGHAQAAADADVAAQTAAGFVVRHRVGQALLDLDVVALAENLFDAPFGHPGTPQVCAIVRHDVQGNHLSVPHRLAGGGVHSHPAQPGIDGGRGDLSGADRLHGCPWAMLRVAAGKDARHFGHQGLRVRNNEAAYIFDPAAIEDRQVGALTGGEDHVIGFELQQAGGVEYRIEAAVRIVRPLAELQGDLAFLIDADRAPARVQLHAFGDCVFDLVRTGRHFAALLEGGHVDVRRALAQSRQGDVNGDVSAADDDDPRPDPHRFAAAHGMQEVDAARARRIDGHHRSG